VDELGRLSPIDREQIGPLSILVEIQVPLSDQSPTRLIKVSAGSPCAEFGNPLP
jgi:hypothetical protein